MLQKVGNSNYDVPDPDLECVKVPIEFFITGLRPGSAWLLFHRRDRGFCGWGYDGNCPKCGSDNLRNSGSYDACNECGFRIEFSEFIFDG